MRRQRLAPLLVVLLALLTAGCTSDGEQPDAAPTKAEDAALLQPAWQVDSIGPFEDDGGQALDPQHSDFGLMPGWVLDELVIVPAPDQVTAFDVATGDVRWSLKPPPLAQGVCALSEGLNDDGIGAVLFSREDQGCSMLTAVQARTGETVWTQSVDFHYAANGYINGSIGVGEQVVSVVTNGQSCVVARRFALADGQSRSALPSDDRCAHSAASRGGAVVAQTESPDGQGTLEVYDAETGRLRGRSPIENYWAVSLPVADPVVIDIMGSDSRSVGLYDDRGRQQAVLATSPDTVRGLRTIGVTEDAIVAEFGPGGDRVHAFNRQSGKKLWELTRHYEQTPLGVHDGALLTATLMRGVYTDRRQDEAWITRSSIDDPTQVEILAQIPHSPSVRYAVNGDVLLCLDAGTLTAYKLPASGKRATTTSIGIEPAEDQS